MRPTKILVILRTRVGIDGLLAYPIILRVKRALKGDEN